MNTLELLTQHLGIDINQLKPSPEEMKRKIAMF